MKPGPVKDCVAIFLNLYVAFQEQGAPKPSTERQTLQRQNSGDLTSPAVVLCLPSLKHKRLSGESAMRTDGAVRKMCGR